MKELPIAWLLEDELANIRQFDLSFEKAKEVLLNTVSLRLPNIAGDSVYVGLTDDMKHVLFVYCKREDKFRKIILARRASKHERDAFFESIARFV
jgi:uncharacterized DUF497 family protein